MNIENVILANLQYNEDFARRILPFIKKEYFSNPYLKECFVKVYDYFTTYNSLPSRDALMVEIQNTVLPESIFNRTLEAVDELFETSKNPTNQQWLIGQTEEYCKNRALSLALQQSLAIADGDDVNLTRTAIPDLLSKALALTFEDRLGHDYIDDHSERYDYYTSTVSKLPFRMDFFNKITNGGVERKTLNIVSAKTGGGKSLYLTNISSDYLRDGYNVLYITLEMEEKKIAQRIDANLMDLPIQELKTMSRPTYEMNIDNIARKYKGRIKIVEFAPNSVSVANFRYLLREYKTKFSFVPDVIVVDYLGICGSSRYPKAGQVNTYQYYKSVAEELRGFAVENNLVVWSALQLNRGSLGSTDVGMENTSDSMGGPFTFDFFFALIDSEDLLKLGQIKIKQLKSRYEDINKYPSFVVGLDRPRMKFYDLNSGQQTATTLQPVAGHQTTNSQPSTFTPKNKFSKLKVD